jgi:drug/metabolite transporter (DMT)-like permease
MFRRYGPLIFVLAAIWGASYLFIKVGVRDFEPTVLMTLRLFIGGLILLLFLTLTTGGRQAVASVRAAWREGLVFGTINGALPFTLIAWGEKHIDSGVAAIANASVPIFVAILATWVFPSERVTGVRLFGVLLGLLGVGVLAGFNPEGGWWAVAGTLAVVVASIAYAWSNLFSQPRIGAAGAVVLAAGSMVGGALVMLPLGLAQLPDHVPSWKALGSVAALGILGTAVAQLILYRMLHLHGSARTTLVSYLIPVTALFYGIVILDEPLTLAKVGGLALILVGVALGSGILRLSRRRAPVTATPAP